MKIAHFFLLIVLVAFIYPGEATINKPSIMKKVDQPLVGAAQGSGARTFGLGLLLKKKFLAKKLLKKKLLLG